MADISISTFQLAGAAGETIRGYVHTPAGDEKLPVALLAHGFKGFAGYGFLPLMADRLAEAGSVVVRFSFSHCGVADNPDSFDRADLFEHDTYAKQVADVLALIAAVRGGSLPDADRFDTGRMAMVGHSRGGVTTVLATGSTEAFGAIVTLASPDTTLHDPAMAEAIRAAGRVLSPSSRTGQDLYIGREVVDDIDRAGEAYDLHKLLGRFDKPYMAVHCEGDQTVAFACSERLAAAHTAGPSELLIVPAGGHTFDFAHGQPGSTPALDLVVERVVAFLNRHLS